MALAKIIPLRPARPVAPSSSRTVLVSVEWDEARPVRRGVRPLHRDRSPATASTRRTTGPTNTAVTPNWPRCSPPSWTGGPPDASASGSRRGRLRAGGRPGRHRRGRVVHPHPRHRRPARTARLDGLGHRGLHRPDLRHGRPRTPARQAHRPPYAAAVLADARPGRRDPAVPGRQPRPGRTDRLGLADRRAPRRARSWSPSRCSNAAPSARRPAPRPRPSCLVPGPAVLRTAVPGRRLRPGRPGRRRRTKANSSPSRPPPSSRPGRSLLAFARRVADEHQTRHGRPITRDALRARLGVSNQLASDLLHQIRTA